MTVIGYKVLDRRGNLFEDIVGTVKRMVLDRHRRAGRNVRKVIKK